MLLIVIFQSGLKHLSSGAAVRVAVVASNAVVRIAGYALVIIVRLGLVIVRMAIEAIEHRVIA